MTKISKNLGFTTVELLVTLFVAAIFLVAGYQLYALIVNDGGEARAKAQASNVAYQYLQQYKESATSPCSTQAPKNNESITVPKLSDVTLSVNITCPYSTVTAVSKVVVTVKYNTPQQSVSIATYANK